MTPGSDSGENQSQQAKGAEQFSAEARRGQRLQQSLLHGLEVRQRNRRNQRLHGGADARERLVRVILGTRIHGHRWCVVLLQRHINDRLRRFAKRQVLDRVYSTDYGNVPGLSEEMDVLANGILPGPEVFGHSLVDDRDHGSRLAVLVSEGTATQQRDARSLEKSGSNGDQWSQLAVARIACIHAVSERSSLQASSEGRGIGDARAGNGGKRLETLHNVAIKSFGLRLRVLRGAQVHEHDELVLHFKAGINLLRVPQAMDE